MELQQARERYERHGLNVAALSYDPVSVLREFATRKGITYPLLSDPKSQVIRAFGILNQSFHPGELPYGVPHPGMYIIDERGIVQAKYFEENFTERDTASSILVRQFGETGGTRIEEAETRHLKVTYGASDRAAPPGGRVALFLDLDLKPGMHVYAPGVQGGYIPIQWQITDSREFRADPPKFPQSEMLHLDAIDETVPVYRGRVRLLRDITLAGRNVLKPDSEVTIRGAFRYQACDDKMCYVPQTVPLEWTVHINPLDSQRASHR